MAYIVCSKCKKYMEPRSHCWCKCCLREAMRIWREKNPEKSKKQRRESARRRYAENPARIAEINKRSRAKCDKKKRRAASLEYERRRRKDPIIRLISNLRCRLGDAVRRANTTKIDHSIPLIGCSREQLVKHLESQFTSGMSWENYGIRGWHVDHIRPCSTFDLTDPDQQRECFHYSNLRPLWWHENLSRNRKYPAKELA